MVFNMFYLTFTPFASSLYFKISSFTSNNNQILYRGSAAPSSGAVQLNPVNYVCQVGQAIYADRVQMWDSSSGKVADFTTRFSFTIDTDDQANYGDGFAFFLGPADFQIPPNSAGSFLGLYNLSNYRESSQNHMIHVEFDSFVDTDWDPSYEHVGINKNSIFSANTTAWSAGNHSVDVADVTISYSSQTMLLIVSWTYNNPTPETSSVSYHVDIKEVLTEWVTIGFSAGTGNLKEKNTLLSWEFDSSLNGIWRSPEERPGVSTAGYLVPGAIGVIIGMVIATIIIGILLFIFFKKGCWIKGKGRRTKKSTQEKNKLIKKSSSADIESEGRSAPLKYSYSDLLLATNGFSHKNKLGAGGSGDVYKGRLPIPFLQEVAVKKISDDSTQGENECAAEVATIGKLKHPNLVELVGLCEEQGKFLLIYEIMPNGSLDSYLFGNKGPLGWSNRYKIVQGLASALHHLHEEQGETYVIHRDIKPSNVMLDLEFNPKLGDFGLARLKDSNEQGSKTTKVAGTLGYFAPEYVTSRKASKATDMYSFGVTVLEIGSGRSVANQISDMDLIEWVTHLYREKQLLLTVDERLSHDVNEKQYNCLMTVGLSCTHPDPSKRLIIEEVIHALKHVIPPKVPVYFFSKLRCEFLQNANGLSACYKKSGQTSVSPLIASPITLYDPNPRLPLLVNLNRQINVLIQWLGALLAQLQYRRNFVAAKGKIVTAKGRDKEMRDKFPPLMSMLIANGRR
uniref:Protein kinase domain-containing protein n=1 Tax=Lactuca sativa TaxID=4236 RepID=A0A9R1XJB4_LACSA|nr:hypothetical protein LSAT_V11C400212420 [Lactuca sativa]